MLTSLQCMSLDWRKKPACKEESLHHSLPKANSAHRGWKLESNPSIQICKNNVPTTTPRGPHQLVPIQFNFICKALYSELIQLGIPSWELFSRFSNAIISMVQIIFMSRDEQDSCSTSHRNMCMQMQVIFICFSQTSKKKLNFLWASVLSVEMLLVQKLGKSTWNFVSTADIFTKQLSRNLDVDLNLDKQ